MPAFPSFSFPTSQTHANNAFAPAQIDFSKIGQLYDSYADAQNDRLKRDAFQAQQDAAKAERDRQSQVRQVFASGLPKDAQGNIDYAAASERLMALDPSQGVDFLKMGSQEADRQTQRGIQREQLVPADVREYQFYAGEEKKAGRQALPYNEWKRTAAAGSGKYGTTVQYTKDGRPWVTANDGTVKFLDLGGAEPLGPEGTAAARAHGTATGKTRAEAARDLPAVRDNAYTAIGTLKAIKNSSKLPSMVGMVGGRTPDISEEANEVAALIDQTQGQTFLTAFERLKGGGAITEVEGTKGSQAIARLGNRKMSLSAYNAAIDDLIHVIENGVARSEYQAGLITQEQLEARLHKFGATLPAPGSDGAGPRQNYWDPPKGAGNDTSTQKRAPVDVGDGFSVEIQ